MAPLTVLLLLVGNILDVSAQQRNAKTIIIGAGMTGTMAAKTLHEAGETDFIIIEATNRVGGRQWAIPFGGITVEVGASWYHGGNGNPVFERARDIGMDYRLTRYFDLAARDENGNDITDEMNEVFEELDPIVEDAELYGRALMCEEPEKVDRSFRRQMFHDGWQPKTQAERVADYFNVDFETGQYADDSSTRYYYSWGNEDFVISADYYSTDPRGYAHVTRSFLDDVMEEDDPRLIFSVTVQSVSQNDTHVTVQTSIGEFTSEYLISTVGLGVLQQRTIEFDPPLPAEKTEAIDLHKMALYTTVYMKFEEEFWDDAEWIFYVSGRPRYWAIWQNMNKAHPGSNILEATIAGEEAERVEGLSNAEVQAEAMGALRAMYGESVPEPTSILVPRWKNLNNFYGAFSDVPTGYDANLVQTLRQPHGRVHFAGEAMSSRYFGYLHGSYYEGIRGAEFLMECMGNPDCEAEVPNECPDGETKKPVRTTARHRRGMGVAS